MRHIAVVLVALGLIGCTKEPPGPSASPVRPPGPVRITHFYAGSPEVESGATVGFCYGVQDARQVRIEPSVGEPLAPGSNRCFYVPLASTVTYRLTAEGFDGTSATQSVTVKVKPAPLRQAAPAADRLITMIFASAPEISAGDSVTLCYGAPEAASVEVEPVVQKLKPAERYCFSVSPERTTTYTISAHAKNGNVESTELTVRVR